MTGARPDVAVTGIGLVTPAGTGREATWDGVCAGRPTARHVPELKGLPVDFACLVPDFSPRAHVPGARPWQYDRFTQFALCAALEAVSDAGLDPADWDADRVAVVFGSSAGGTGTMLDQHRKLLEAGTARVSPLLLPMFLPNMATGQLTIHLRARGPALCTVTACASGATAIGTALQLLRSGACDIAVAGASDAVVQPLWVTGFDRMGALSRRGDDPQAASRPFDTARDGFVMAEGGAALVLEPASAARARGRAGYALLAGYGASSDAHHPVAPDPEGKGAALAVRRALDDAAARPADVQHINAHGTSTPLNDAAEARLIRRLFPHRPSVTSVKGTLGHLLGAAGAVEAAITALSVAHGRVPPVANLEKQEGDTEINAVTGTSRDQPVDLALSHSFGFGGHNAVLAFRSCPTEPAESAPTARRSPTNWRGP
ncbi:beta-ketoacyl synthase [Streptomyces sp. HUAS CX7]|uniref:beta-ketoacyl-[acyl-carrier-protein] synthase family protein n=1 Tax=Streptomyces sp. HUAS CX7 TaxID=3062782 RepID=UPI0026EDA760|nr:beta-ketoacyl-[acyl-carrier-protein] synthase family protein [Streptomyces sp. HUAS CX7]WKX22307.1 beta-ketoacyl-[acyl-carrier-protein] synthase family protein [Streptomyces sp. HUAS CX7]